MAPLATCTARSLAAPDALGQAACARSAAAQRSGHGEPARHLSPCITAQVKSSQAKSSSSQKPAAASWRDRPRPTTCPPASRHASPFHAPARRELDVRSQASQSPDSSAVIEEAGAEAGPVALRPRESGPEEGEVLIELRDVYKSFGDKHILKGATLKIRHGEAVGIIGPSGTGKSTILKVMAGLLAPDSGEVWIAGKKREGLLDDGDDTGLKIGLVFQSAALFDSLTVRENVGFLLYEHSDLSGDEIEERVRHSLLAVGLKGVEDLMPSELSGGMRKRVALARAIISESTTPQDEDEVVMYDEPTAGLDPIASTVVEDLIRSVHSRVEQGLQLGKIASYIVVTHQHSTIRRATDRILFLYDGQVQWEGSVEEFDTTDNPLVRQFAEGSLRGPIQYV